jgi:hypothetical protein
VDRSPAIFVRSVVVGSANPGTEALEKVLNPMIEGVQLPVADGPEPGRPRALERQLSRAR